ncbi:tetratricopeptide repeat protein [Sinobaca sp. H24]|uniref:tetratricopeptide repeat protein n=1 Tax=Sinobaca sp. H24 TaxID=2923376 RepID=UPI00207A1A67|nr:tetratricopeptide repeat protein [Sinobaca sp. H24]
MDLIKIYDMINNGRVEEGLEKLAALEKTASHQEKYDILQVYEELGLADKSKPIIDELIQHYPDETELYLIAAENAIDLDQEEDAIEWLLEIKEEDDNFLQAQMLLADLYQLQGLDEVAETRLLQALQKAPEEPVLLAGLGEYYLERGDFAKSIPYLKQAEQHGFQYPEGSLSLRLAEAYSATGQFEDAMKYYKTGLEEKREMNALFGYAYTALQVKDYELAAQKFEELKAMDYEYASLYPYLIQAYKHQKKWEAAFEAVQEGLKVDNFNDQLYVEAGIVQWSLENKELAEGYLKEALALNPANAEAASVLFSMWHRYEDYDNMIDLADHLQALGETDVLFEWNKARAYAGRDDLEEALPLFDKVYPELKENTVFLDEYGEVLLEMGYKEKAVLIWNQLLIEEPDNQAAALRIEELEQE